MKKSEKEKKLGKEWRWGLFGVIAYSLFRFIESLFVYNVMLRGQPIDISSVTSLAANSFSIYRDFVTVSTGLLAIIAGAIGFGGYISYKKIKGEESRLERLRTKFEVLLKIEEGRVASDSESDPESAVKVYKDTKMDFDDFYVLYLLRGDAFRRRGNEGDYLLAERDYTKALEIHGTSPKAWFGLGQAKFRSVLGRMEYSEPKDVELNIDDVNLFKLTKNVLKVHDEDVGNIKEAVECTKKAISCEYNKPTALFEIGKMYESLGMVDDAIEKYKESYYLDTSNSANGFYYAYAWLKRNIDNLSHPEIFQIEKILKQAGMMNLFHSKPAYALLWYIYNVVPSLKSKASSDKALMATNRYVIDDLFEM